MPSFVFGAIITYLYITKVIKNLMIMNFNNFYTIMNNNKKFICCNYNNQYIAQKIYNQSQDNLCKMGKLNFFGQYIINSAITDYLLLNLEELITLLH
jgi:hypothetical protein